MWCDNCLLLFPLRVGAMAWAFIIMAYSVAGGIFLFRDGQFLFFVFPEWQIYGGVAMGVAAMALITIFTLGNRSYIWTRVCKFIWPFVIIISAIRATIMIVELQRGKDKIEWECANGGQLWPDSSAAADSSSSTGTFPSGFCTSGFSNLNAAFIVSLLIDLVFQIYMFFLIWRYQKRIENYQNMKGPFAGGTYGLISSVSPVMRSVASTLALASCLTAGAVPFT
ncbi:hypothetical protein BC629DRAFT_1731459 [Irpex lacteus]|nr:hypothetical protein BC629DRAFT_1731459 [Irpex lacteus]